MSSSVKLPPGWEIVERKKWQDSKRKSFVLDDKNPQVDYTELFVREISTGDLYLWKQEHIIGDEKLIHTETEGVLRGKAIAIVWGMTIYLVMKCARDIFILFTSVGVDLVHGRLWCVIKDCAHFVWGKFRDPFFAIATLACAVLTLFKPFEGRKRLASVERKWHSVDALKLPGQRIHYQECAHHDTCTPDREGIPAIFSRNHYFLIAYCFQPHGNSQDLRYLVNKVTC